MRLRSQSALLLLIVITGSATAQVTPIGPFTGTALGAVHQPHVPAVVPDL